MYSRNTVYVRCISFTGVTLREMEATSQQVGVHDIRLAEMDVRFQCLETANYAGVLIWKVTDYARRKQDAFQNRVSSILCTIRPRFTLVILQSCNYSHSRVVVEIYVRT